MNKRSADVTRQAILTATRKIFAAHGYEQASMRAIAREAGVSVGGLYLHFRGKEELYLTLTEEWMAELNSVTSAALGSIADPREAIAAFIITSINFTRKRKEMILFQGRMMNFACAGELKRKFFRDRRDLITGIINKGIEAGQFRDQNGEEAAKVIFNILRGFFISLIFEEEALFTPDACVDLVLNGLVRRNNE